MFLEGTSTVFNTAWIFEVSKNTGSPSINSLSFTGIHDICESDNCSVKIASVPDVFPSIISPTNKSAVFPSTVFIEDSVNFGADGSLVSVDSKIPCISNTSVSYTHLTLPTNREV